MKGKILAVGILTVAMTMVGCGASFDPSTASLYIGKNGKIKQAMVESFAMPYYSLDEFESMLNKELETYNSKYENEKISIDQLELEEDTLYLVLDYEDAEIFEQYNEEFCFIGSIEDALLQGISFNSNFKDADNVEHTATEVTEKKSNQVAVLQSEGVIELQKSVQYVSENVEIISDHMVQVMPIEDSAEYAYIIY